MEFVIYLQVVSYLFQGFTATSSPSCVANGLLVHNLQVIVKTLLSKVGQVRSVLAVRFD